MLDIVDDITAISDSACRAVSTLAPPEKAREFNTQFMSFVCDSAESNRDLKAAAQDADLVALNSLALLSFEFDTRQARLAEGFDRLQREVN